MAESLGAAGAIGLVCGRARARRRPSARGWLRQGSFLPAWAPLLMVLVGQSLLSGCAATGEVPPEKASNAAGVLQQAGAVAAFPSSRSAIPVSVASLSASGADSAAAGSSTAVLVSLPPDFGRDPGRLRSLSARQVISLFGDPDFRRDDPPAQLWQYRAGGCVLDLFLYPEGGMHRVTYADWRARDTSAPALQSCMDQILRGRRATATASRL